MKVYIVRGTTGEYEDRIEWDAKAFLNENKANALCKQLNQICDMALFDYAIEEKLKHLDEDALVDYTGTSYSIIILDVEE